MIKRVLLVLSVLILIVSCSIEKRVHTSGYHIDWKKSSKSQLKAQKSPNTGLQKEVLSSTKIEIKNKNTSKLENISLSFDNKTTIKPSSVDTKESYNKPNYDDCDVIVFKNRSEVEAKVLEVGVSEVKYKLCDNQDGPVFTESKDKISMIRFANGSKTSFSNQESDEEKTKIIVDEKDYLDTIEGNDKSFFIAILLWAFFGLLGIHRFYLGHIVIGIIYLLTGGLCGIGWIIDGILFLTGNLKPRRGKYIDL